MTWVVWWWRGDLDDADVPVPEEREFRFYPEAVEFCVELSAAKPEPLWVKMFGPTEHEVRLRWKPGRGFYELAPMARAIVEKHGLVAA